MNVSYGDKSSYEESDLGPLWEEALVKYYEECGTDLRSLPASRLNAAHIRAEQEHQLLLFNEYRHDKGKLDKLRSLVSQNSDIVINVATHIANAASAAFPPSAAILTAFNYVMNASRAVSEDYDMIVSFFDVMNSFLERISMLESRMPEEWQFRRFLVNVFSAMMTLSAIARKCRLKGRLTRWAKALIDGSDPKLKGAFDSLHMHLERFESAAMLTTLKHTLESGKRLDYLGQGVEQIQGGIKQLQMGVEKNQVLSQQTYAMGLESKNYSMDAASTSHDILTVVTRQEQQSSEYTTGLYKVMRSLDKMSRQNGAQEKFVDSGSRKSIAMRTLETVLAYKLDDRADFMNFEKTYVDGTYDWFQTQDVYKDFEVGKVRLLWVRGPAGMGKSMLAYTIVRALQDEFIGDATIAVAHYFFRDDGNRRFVSQMLRSCALQVAMQDSSYREEAVTEVHTHKNISRKAESNSDLKDDQVALWESLFLTKFTKKSRRRLVLILDGVDEADEKDRQHITKMLQNVSGSDHTNIQVLFVSDPGKFSPVAETSASIFELKKELILPDMRAMIVARLRSSIRMRKLSKQTRRKIVTKLPKQADTMRYVEHMIRSFTQLGRSESAILRQLNHLPSSITGLYKSILEECERSRTNQELASLKKLFAWLAYRTGPLSLGCARKLITHIDTNNSINIDEELETGCNRIIRLTNLAIVHDTDEEFEDSDIATDQSDDDEPLETDGDEVADHWSIVDFQEKGLRSYFCPLQNQVEDSLRTSTSSGHTIILEIIQSILCTESVNEKDFGERALLVYAASSWAHHLQAINPAELSEEETVCVIESVCKILSNRGGSVRKMESLRPLWNPKGLPCVLGKTEKDIGNILACLQTWAERTVMIFASRISDTTAAWMFPLACNPYSVFISLAEAHITNWLTNCGHMKDWEVNMSYLFAHYALYRGRYLCAVQQNESLKGYFMGCAYRGDMRSGTPTRESFIMVSRAFPHTGMTARSCLSVAVSMFYNGLLEPSLEQLDLGIRQPATQIEAMEIYMRMGQIRIKMAEAIGTSVEGAEPRPIGADFHEGGDLENDQNHESTVQKFHQWTGGALEAVIKATDIISALSESALQDNRVQSIAYSVWMLKAKAEIMRGDTSNTIAYCKHAIQICPTDNGPMHSGILPLLAETRSWSIFLEVVKVLSGVGWLSSLICLEKYMHEIHSAAKATGETEYVTEQYQHALPVAEFNGANESRLMVNWAQFYYHVDGTPAAISKAKNLLNKAIDAKGSTHYLPASFCLSDILLEEFRGTTQLEKKMEVYSEMHDLMKRVSESMGSEFNPSQSQIVIPLAHMARKMNAFEFNHGLRQTFEGCVAALIGEEGWTDTLSLRMLAKVLALVGLERDAQIAATCQIYGLDEQRLERENHWRRKNADDGEVLGDAHPSDSLSSPTSTQPNQVENERPERYEEEASEKSFSNPEVLDNGRNWEAGAITCSDCDTLIQQWSKDAVYLCYYCTEVDLCQACFDKRSDNNTGKTCHDWRVICPQGHRHIQMPVKGWGGLIGGVINIEDEKMQFYDWVMEVKEKKWPDVWDKFWSTE